VETGEKQRRGDQMRAGRPVRRADLDTRAGPAFVRHPQESGAVVVSPVGVRGREAVGQESLVGVDRRPEQSLKTGCVLDHAGAELGRKRAEPLGASFVAEYVAAAVARQREVEVEAGAALV